jgi:hypothetical protein
MTSIKVLIEVGNSGNCLNPESNGLGLLASQAREVCTFSANESLCVDFPTDDWLDWASSAFVAIAFPTDSLMESQRLMIFPQSSPLRRISHPFGSNPKASIIFVKYSMISTNLLFSSLA